MSRRGGPKVSLPETTATHLEYLSGLADPQQDVHLRHYLAILRRRRWWVVSVFFLVVAIGAWLTFRATSIYQAQATLRIETSDPQRTILSDMPPLQPFSNPIDTEVQILRSRSLAEKVVRGVGLNVRVLEPEGRRSETIDSVSVTGEVDPGQYVLIRGAESWVVRRDGRVVARGSLKQPLQFAGIRAVLAERVKPGTTVVLSISRPEDAAGGFLGNLNVSVPVEWSNIVRLAYRDSDPELARAAVNVLAVEFIASSIVTSKSEARSTREFIEGQLGQLSKELQRSEEELQSFKEESKVVALSKEAELGVENYAAFEAERDRYIAERNALATLMQEGNSQTEDENDLSSFPSFIENDAIQQLKAQLNELENKKELLLAEATPMHPDVIAVQQQIDHVRSRLDNAAKGYQRALASKIKALDASLAGFQGQLEKMPEKEVRLAQLIRAQKVAEELYTQLQMKLKEAQIAEAVESASMRVVDAAVTPQAPIRPNKRGNMIVAVIIGLMLGCGMALTRDYFDNTLRTWEHVERDLRLSMVGIVPRIEAYGRNALPRGFPQRLLGLPKGSGKDGNGALDPRLLTQLPPNSPAAESFRALRTNLGFLPIEGRGNGSRLMLVTSPGPHEGKTVIAANLAISFAQQGTRTVLIDADLRRGIQHRRFELARKKGLADFLAGDIRLGDVVRRTQVPGLYVIPCGSNMPLPTELLGSDKMDRLLTILTSQIEVVVIDSSPILPVADAMVLSTKVDDVLLVIRSGYTDRSAASDALALLSTPNSTRVTCVLNGMDYEEAYGRRYYQQYYQTYDDTTLQGDRADLTDLGLEDDQAHSTEEGAPASSRRRASSDPKGT